MSGSGDDEDALQYARDWIAIREAAITELKRRQLFASFEDENDRARATRLLEIAETWPQGMPPRATSSPILIRATEEGVDPDADTLVGGGGCFSVRIERRRRGQAPIVVLETQDTEPHAVVLHVARGTVG